MDAVRRNTLTKGHSGFVEVDLLSRNALIQMDALLDAVAISLIRFKENQAVVSKKEVRNCRAFSGHFYPLDVIKGGLLVNDRRETLRAKHKEVRGKMIFLSETPRWFDLVRQASINLESVGDRSDAIHDEIDPVLIETH